MRYFLVLIFLSSVSLYTAEQIRIKRGFLHGISSGSTDGLDSFNEIASIPVGYPPSISVPPVSEGITDFVEQPLQDVITAPDSGISEDPSSDSISVEAANSRSGLLFGARRYPPVVDSDSVSIESAASFPGSGVGSGIGAGGGVITSGSPGSLLESYVPSILGGIQSRRVSWF